MIFKGNWAGSKDIHNPALLDPLRKQLAPNHNFQIIWSAHGGGVFQVEKRSDTEKFWTPSVVYVKKPSVQVKTIYAIQVDEDFPLLVTNLLEGQMSQWLAADKIVSLFRRWAETEMSAEHFREFWADVVSSVIARILLYQPGYFAVFLAELSDTGKIFGPTIEPSMNRKYSRIETFRRFRDDLEEAREWKRLTRDAKLYVLTVLGTEFSRRWSGWDKVKGN